MATEVKLPELGENVETGFVVKVLVAEGDTIAVEQGIIALETDKATVEVPSPVAGTVTAVHVKEQDEIRVGQAIISVDESGEAKPAAPAAKQTPAPQAAPNKEAPKAQTPPAKPQPPRAAPAPEAPKAPAPVETTPTTPRVDGVPASPSVRAFARDLGVDISAVRGTGPDGRVSEDDVKAYARRRIEVADVSERLAPPPLPDFSKWGPVERQPMSNIRRRTAEHLAVAWSESPRVTQFDRADVTELERARKQFGPKAEAAGGKLTLTAILVKIVASALKTFPQFASAVDTTHNEIVLRKYCHIGIAVDTERGLIVPVIRDADRKNMIEIAVEMTQLAERTRQAKVTLEELQGGVFTITNLGGIGGTYFTPIVNYPQVAILGVGRARSEVALRDDELVERLVLPLALSYDHRVIDGADGARFIRWVVEALEAPLKLPLEG